jgi:hypothetical protein
VVDRGDRERLVCLPPGAGAAAARLAMWLLRAGARSDEDARFRPARGLTWTDNPVGKGLYEALVALASAGILAHGQEPDDRFRWAGLAP